VKNEARAAVNPHGGNEGLPTSRGIAQLRNTAESQADDSGRVAVPDLKSRFLLTHQNLKKTKLRDVSILDTLGQLCGA
jgi:hypothetical protein